MDLGMILTMLSVLIGFVFMGAAFASFSYKKPRKIVLTFFLCAIVFLTLIPLSLAIFYAA